jgi:hypothetical protein
MKFDELTKILDEHNKKSLSKLQGMDRVISKMREGDASVCMPHTPGEGHVVGCECYCGSTTHADNGFDLQTLSLRLKDDAGQTVKVAVGSVLDQGTQNSPDTLPVVLAVGINYGQGDSYANTLVSLVEDTGMRARVERVRHQLSDAWCEKTVEWNSDGEFHLVAANIFPWITTSSWSGLELNAIEEMLLVKCSGHKDPVKHIDELIEQIKPQILIFHGANNIVPSLGNRIEILSNGPLNTSETAIVFADNLAPPANKISNAVMLAHVIGREAMIYNDSDS